MPGGGRRRVRAGARPYPRRRAQEPRASRPQRMPSLRSGPSVPGRRSGSFRVACNFQVYTSQARIWLAQRRQRHRVHNGRRLARGGVPKVGPDHVCNRLPVLHRANLHGRHNCDQKIVSTSVEKLKEVLEIYEARLSKSRYLAGDFISLADLSHSPMFHYLLATPHAPVLSGYSHVKSWIYGIMDRPSVKKITGLMKAS